MVFPQGLDIVADIVALLRVRRRLLAVYDQVSCPVDTLPAQFQFNFASISGRESSHEIGVLGSLDHDVLQAGVLEHVQHVVSDTDDAALVERRSLQLVLF